MKLKIKYADHVEALDAIPEGDNFRLKTHSLFMPLAPGDIVSARGGVISGIVELTPVFMVEVYFPLSTPPETVRDHAARWRLATDVTQPTALTVLVSSESRSWIDDEVVPRAWWVDLLRYPGSTFNFGQAVQSA